MKMTQVILCAGLCSIASLYSMEKTTPDQEVIKAMFNAERMKSNFERPGFIENYKTTLKTMPLEDLIAEEAKCNNVIITMNSIPEKQQIFDDTIQKTQSLLNYIQHLRHTKTSFMQRHPKLIIFGGLSCALLFLGYVVYKRLSCKEEGLILPLPKEQNYKESI